MSPEEMSSLDEQCKESQGEVSEQRKILAALEKGLHIPSFNTDHAELAMVESAPKTKDLPAAIQAASAEVSL